MDQLDAAGVRTRELAYFSKHGKPIWSEPRGLEAGYKWPQFSIHRGTLQQILLDAATERLGPDNILTSHHLSGWTETESGVRAEFIDKATGKPAGTLRRRAADRLPTASIPPCAKSSIRRKARRSGTAASSGAASPRAMRSCPAAP